MLVNQDICPGANGIKMCCEWSCFFFYFYFLFFCSENRHISIFNFGSEMGISLRSCHSVLTQDLHVLIAANFVPVLPANKQMSHCIVIWTYYFLFSTTFYVYWRVYWLNLWQVSKTFFLNMWVCIIWVCSFMTLLVEVRLHGCLYGFGDTVVNVGNSFKTVLSYSDRFTN
jgi:hypothetical protein